MTQVQIIPTVEEALRHPGISHWLKDALRGAIDRDPVKAANDAQLLFDILDANACAAVERSLRHAQTVGGEKP